MLVSMYVCMNLCMYANEYNSLYKNYIILNNKSVINTEGTKISVIYYYIHKEGTRSLTGQLLSFKKGAFYLWVYFNSYHIIIILLL